MFNNYNLNEIFLFFFILVYTEKNVPVVPTRKYKQNEF